MTNLKTVPVESITTSPAARFDFLASFVGFGPDDWEAMQESAVVIGPVLSDVLDGLYEHLLSWDDTRRLFLGRDGEFDATYIATRKEHLTEWVLRCLDGGSDPTSLADYLVKVAKAHTGTVGEDFRVVPPRYMVALTSFVQTAFLSSLATALPDDAAKAFRMGSAWNKFLMIELEIFLKVLAPCFPHWDESNAGF